MSKDIKKSNTLKDLSKWERNPRKITASKARILAKTLMEYGDLSGIVFNKQNKRLVGGHQRVDALATAEIVVEETFKVPTKTGTVALGYAVIDGEKYTYREVMWDEAKHTAAAIAANKAGGEWDMFLLKDLILDLDCLNIDVELTGFDGVEIENIVNAYKNLESIGAEKNDVNEAYEGMPEYDHEDDRPFKKILVKFENQEDYDFFCERLELDVTKSTSSIWYPQRERRETSTEVYETMLDEEP